MRGAGLPSQPTTPVTGDPELVAAILRRDRKATADFVALHADALYSYVRSRLTPLTDEVDDLLQEIFLAAWRNLPDYRGDSGLRSWLLGIARHKIQDYYRVRLRRAETELESEEASHPDLQVVPEWDELLDRAAATKRANRVLSGLPESYRLALRWRYWDKCSVHEMAETTGKTEKSLERLLARARAQFKRRWNDG